MASKKFCVIGLGHFGLNLSLRLSEQGADVMSIDSRQELVDMISDKVALAVCMDSTDEKAMRSFDLQEMDAVIVAIGEKFESSLLTTAILQDIGVQSIYARIISPVHEKMLRLMNITEVFLPEALMADELSKRLIMPELIHTFSIHEDYRVYELNAPSDFIGKDLISINLRGKYNLNLVTILRKKDSKALLSLGNTEKTMIIGVPKPETIIEENDILLIFGRERDIRKIIND